jgi:hypothetical protein
MQNILSKSGLYAFTVALILQGGHMVEHVTQLYQHAFLYLPIKESHGVLFFFDLEWNHFDFNLLYFLLLAWAFIALAFFSKEAWQGGRKESFFRYTFLLGFAVQGYHVLEHTARIGQMLQTGCTPCPGFLGWFFDGIYLHFTLNAITFLLPLIAFFGLNLHRALLARLTKKAVV